ncbi:hypothetical protein ACJJTC_016346 [Scirpophaga incertulas]
MKLNSNLKIEGTKVILIPYKKQHVTKYHTWMKSPELQELTASEPLSLEEEYNMQKQWQNDKDKCTFILLEKSKYYETNNEIESMIGDTNIFINNEQASGEIEIMIAEKYARGKRLGWESVLLMLLFGIKYIDLKVFEAKISVKNKTSIQMFKKLGFEETSKSEVFQEVTLEKTVTKIWCDWLQQQCSYNIQPYS